MGKHMRRMRFVMWITDLVFFVVEKIVGAVDRSKRRKLRGRKDKDNDDIYFEG